MSQPESTNRSVLPTAEEKPAFVNSMFARIAPTYDLVNRLMTLGQDQRWRRELLALCNLPPNGALLDVGTGTGDIAYEAMRLYPTVQAYGADFTFEMMAAGVGKAPGFALPFTQADVNHLPYPDGTFDAVVSGFLVRNVVDRTAAFREMARVTKPGGRVVCLETTPPGESLVGQGSELYFRKVVPILGGIVSGDSTAYTYLPQSTTSFVEPEELKRTMERAGLQGVIYRTLMFGTVAIHVGIR
jgi:demethylmenaquinone methyltransferase/2-methoxy-6-polyprenyl-1,4-benzoquinol methylase